MVFTKRGLLQGKEGVKKRDTYGQEVRGGVRKSRKT